MRIAVVESGGKQYRAVEGMAIEVDRLAAEPGKEISFDRVLLMADADEIHVGTPTVDEIQVRGTVLAHFRGPKLISFRYSPKKRIRVKGGHRQQYTRVIVNFIGRSGEDRKQHTIESDKPAASPRKTKPAAAKKAAAKKGTPRKTAAGRK